MKHWFIFWFLFFIICSAFALNHVAVSIGSTNNPQPAENEGTQLKIHGNIDGLMESQEKFYMDDYRPIDPVPNSKNSIRHGMIQHDIPLMPFIPKPSPPPNQAGQDGSP